MVAVWESCQLQEVSKIIITQSNSNSIVIVTAVVVVALTFFSLEYLLPLNICLMWEAVVFCIFSGAMIHQLKL